MKFTHVILLTTEMYLSIVEGALTPDINLEGSSLTNKDSKVLQLICSTNIAVQLCTAEFLIDKRTHEYIQYFDNNCYDTMSICSPAVCMCSNDCKSFTLNVTVTQDMMNHSYSCASRIEQDGVTYLANMSVIYDGKGGLKLDKKIVVPNRSVSTMQRATTFSPEITTVSYISEPLIIAGTAFGFLSCVLLFILICQRRYSTSAKDLPTNKKHQQKKGDNSYGITDPANDSSGMKINKHDIFKVRAEINNAGTRLSVASSNPSDNRSFDVLFKNASDNVERESSTYV